ncbi:MAG: HEPN domain-containing protein [Candidatus Bathyarchaeota archaeon]|nr:HEPN domain-containing protein [Candidatus Bathyarchaeum sp.]
MQNPKQRLNWCLKQPKGIRLVTPSENLAKAYHKKAENALKSMEINAQAGLTDWAVSASYYAKYFAAYSSLSKIGVKSEIHDCTITLFEHIFCDSISSELLKDLRNSKKDRVEMQYYTQEIQVDLKQIIKKTKKFVLEIEKIIDDLTTEKITELQNKLKNLQQNRPQPQ